MATLYYRPYTSEPIKDGEMPPHDAIENILPEYQYIFVDPNSKSTAPGKKITDHVRPDDIDKSQMSLLDHQMRELEKYRTAVHKMGQDILTLRDRIRDVEGENSKLRRDLARYNDATKLLMDSQELDGLTKPELAARYVSLKQKLTTQTGEIRNYKDEVQKLQNQLISKNDNEKDFARMTHAHQSQNELLQHLQSKAQRVKRLEEACKKQEQVIEKMEKMLTGKGTPMKDKEQEKAKQALAEENRKLRNELAELRDVARQNSAESGRESADKLEMFEKLDKADSRIRSLEKQLSENARQWAREKSDLLVKLQEAEHGFWRSAPLHFDYINPKVGLGPSAPPRSHKDVLSRSEEPRRYSKAPTKSKYHPSSSPKLDPIYR